MEIDQRLSAEAHHRVHDDFEVSKDKRADVGEFGLSARRQIPRWGIINNSL
jgi:hypothetical protein